MNTRQRSKRFERIVWAYVMATRCRLPVPPLNELLRAIRSVVPDVSERDLSAAITWARRVGRRDGTKLKAARGARLGRAPAKHGVRCGEKYST
jgi:hypothetical protein